MPVVAKAGSRLALAGRQRVEEGRGLVDAAHALAAAARHGLDQDGIADGVGLGLQPVGRLILAHVAGGDGHARLDHQLLGRVLQAHGPDRGRRCADPDDAGGHDGLGELGVLGQEAVAGVDGLGARRLGCRQHPGLIQIALARRRRADQDGLVGLTDVKRVRIGLGMDRDGAQAHAAGGAEDAAGDLAAIGDQDGSEHGARFRGARGGGRGGRTCVIALPL